MKSLPGEPPIAAFARAHKIACTAKCVAPGRYAWQAAHADRHAGGEVGCSLEAQPDAAVTDEARGLMCLEAVVYAARRATMPASELAEEADGDEAIDAYEALSCLLGSETLVEAAIEALGAGYASQKKSRFVGDFLSDGTIN